MSQSMKEFEEAMLAPLSDEDNPYNHSILLDSEEDAEYVEEMIEGELEGAEDITITEQDDEWVLTFTTPYRINGRKWLNKANSTEGTFNKRPRKKRETLSV